MLGNLFVKFWQNDIDLTCVKLEGTSKLDYCKGVLPLKKGITYIKIDIFQGRLLIMLNKHHKVSNFRATEKHKNSLVTSMVQVIDNGE